MPTIKAIVFDAFGTLVHINNCRTKPYVQLLQLLNDLGRPHEQQDSKKIMTRSVGIIGAAQLFGLTHYAKNDNIVNIVNKLGKIEDDLHNELMKVELYPESADVLLHLRNRGIKIGLCSNLAAPYAVPVKSLLPFELESYSWSFEVGYIKPEYQMYQHVCDSLNLPANQILFVGDTVAADITGPAKFGMQSIHIDRDHHPNSGLYDVVNRLRKCGG
jgi:HAD superfamily hydrolase (TIGR01509 family)